MLLDVLEDSKNKKYVKTQEWWDSETDQEYYARTEIQLPFDID